MFPFGAVPKLSCQLAGSRRNISKIWKPFCLASLSFSPSLPLPCWLFLSFTHFLLCSLRVLPTSFYYVFLWAFLLLYILIIHNTVGCGYNETVLWPPRVQEEFANWKITKANANKQLLTRPALFLCLLSSLFSIAGEVEFPSPFHFL